MVMVMMMVAEYSGVRRMVIVITVMMIGLQLCGYTNMEVGGW